MYLQGLVPALIRSFEVAHTHTQVVQAMQTVQVRATVTYRFKYTSKEIITFFVIWSTFDMT